MVKSTGKGENREWGGVAGVRRRDRQVKGVYLLLCGAINQERPGGVDGVGVAAGDVRPDGRYIPLHQGNL